MSNEFLFLVRGLVSLLALLYVAKLSKGWLYGYIVMNLILITVLGGKFIEVFGLTGNTGNVFYASTFLATYLLVECYGTAAAYRSIRIGSVMVLLFMLMAYLTLAMTGTAESRLIDQALHEVLSISGRVALASIFAFLIAQCINVWIFDALRTKWQGKYFWLRTNISNLLAQLVDTGLFFAIAFLGVVPLSGVWELMVTGYVTKVVFVAVGTVFFERYIATFKRSST